MAEPRIIGADDAGSDAPAPAAPDPAAAPSNGNGNGNGRGHPDAVVRVLRPGVTPPPTVPVPGPADPIAWLAPTEPSFVVLRDDLRDDLYDDLREDLADDLRDDLRHDLRDDLRADLRHDLRDDLRADLDHDLEELREDLYEEVDDLRDEVFPEGDPVPTTVLPALHVRADREVQRDRARRLAFVAATVFAAGVIAAIILVWQRADTAQIVAARPAPVTVAPPDLGNVLAEVERLDQQLAALLAVSASPTTPNDVASQIGALRVELAGVRGCLLAVRRAVDDGVDAASAVEYC